MLRSTYGYNDFNLVSLQRADSYSFAMILYKLKTQSRNAFGNISLKPSQIVLRLIEEDPNSKSTVPLRPDLDLLPDDCREWMKNILHEIWSENPCERPDFKVISNYFVGN